MAPFPMNMTPTKLLSPSGFPGPSTPPFTLVAATADLFAVVGGGRFTKPVPYTQRPRLVRPLLLLLSLVSISLLRAAVIL